MPMSSAQRRQWTRKMAGITGSNSGLVDKSARMTPLQPRQRLGIRRACGGDVSVFPFGFD